MLPMNMIREDTDRYLPSTHSDPCYTWFVYDPNHHLPHPIINISRPKLVFSGTRDECKAYIARHSA